MPAPWEKQPEETPRAFEAFCVYRDLGPNRSLAKTGQKLGKNLTTIQQWSARYRWVERATAWDQEQDRLAREAAIKARMEMAERHAKAALVLMQKALQKLAKMGPDDLEPADVARFLDLAVKIERLSRGEPAEIVRAEDGGERQVTDRERTEIARRILGNKRARELLRRLYRASRDAVAE